jgi:hypothetical protein
MILSSGRPRLRKLSNSLFYVKMAMVGPVAPLGWKRLDSVVL